LAALQSMVISTGLLFTVLLMFMCWCIFRGWQDERAKAK
jgi:BCCT family betaine/carnitine transporter